MKKEDIEKLNKERVFRLNPEDKEELKKLMKKSLPKYHTIED